MMFTLFRAAAAVGLLAAATLPAATLGARAAPVVPLPAPAASSAQVTLVDDFRWRRQGGWHEGWRGNWRGGDWRGGNWRHGGGNGWHENRWRHRRPYFGGPSFYLGFGAPTYEYVVPRYVPHRRVYRGFTRAHIDWCYNRYRSYRAWDNTFQPNYGPRQQCYAPFD